MKKRVFYIGNFIYPDGNAPGKRVAANVILFKQLGYDVIVIGKGNNNTDSEQHYQFLNNRKKILINQDICNYNIFINIFNLHKNDNIEDIIVYYGSPSTSFFLMRLIRFCKKNKITIVSDCVDWLSIKTKNPLFNLVKKTDDVIIKRILNNRVDGLIVISNYLKNYYERKNPNVIVLPPLTLPVSKTTKFSQTQTLSLIYAGQLFRLNERKIKVSTLKDRIDIVIESLYHLKQSYENFVFNIYGFTREEYLLAIPKHKHIIDDLHKNIFFHGRKNNTEVEKNIRKADFSVLIRDDKVESKAGFPTKVTESITQGTPVIITNTGDLGNYITDGVNGFIVNNTVESLLSKLLWLCEMSIDNKNNLKDQCFNSNLFCYNNYLDKTVDFFRKLPYYSRK